MDSQKKNSNILSTQFSGLYQALSSQSIIDVFVVQGLILPADAEKVKIKYQNNLAIERFLLSNKLVSREAINKAYSIILKLPFVGLGSLAIPDNIVGIIPEKIAKKYMVVPFAAKENTLNLAIGSPGDIFLPQNRSLEEIFGSSGMKIELFVTTPDDISKVLNRGKSSTDKVLLNKGGLPVIFLRNRNVDTKNLQLLPLEFILKNRMAIFDKIEEKSFRIAEEDPYNPKTRQIVEYLKKNNGLELEEFSTSKDDIDYLVSLYEKNSNIKTQDLEQETKEEKKKEDGAFSNIVNSLISDNKPGLTIDEQIKTKSDEKNGKSIISKVPVTEDGRKNSYETEVRYEMEQSKRAEAEDRDIGKLLGKDIKTLDELKEVIKENSVPKLVAATISYALSLGSSDIHIEPEAKRLRVRFRIDGILKDMVQLPMEFEAQITSRIKILGMMKLDESRIPQDGRFSVNFMEREVDVRVSMLPTVFGEKTVLRILDKSQGILSLEDLGFVGSAFKIIMEQIKQPYGVILATGPTGSGKSTTLYAILNRINQPGVNVVTLEDPVEYDMPGVNQCQIKPKIGFTFAEGLRSILRQDPNIIMVGEVRDADTASMATHAALTGHLVLTTLHTNDAASALPRLINMGVEPFLITSSVNLIIAQRLVRRVCPKCREKTDIPPALEEAIALELKEIPKVNQDDSVRIKPIQFYRGRGCPECTEGYKGRIGLYELLVMEDEIESLAVSRRPASEIKTAAIKNGMLTMRQDGILKALDGLTTIDEVLLATGEVGMGEATILAKQNLMGKENIVHEVSVKSPETKSTTEEEKKTK
jgi:type IV pilus assembly protein PilB